MARKKTASAPKSRSKAASKTPRKSAAKPASKLQAKTAVKARQIKMDIAAAFQAEIAAKAAAETAAAASTKGASRKQANLADIAAKAAADKAEKAAEKTTTKQRPFDPSKLDRTVIALPLVERFKTGEGAKGGETDPAKRRFPVVIDLNLDFRGGREQARTDVIALVAEVVKPGSDAKKEREAFQAKVLRSSPAQYVATALTQSEIQAIVTRDLAQANDEPAKRRIYRIWPDFEVRACLTKSVTTVKADAARVAFNARGNGIVWAVMDSGIDRLHPHFAEHRNLEVKLPIKHESFIDDDDEAAERDEFGHGTHVAGIIAGCLKIPVPDKTSSKTRKSAKQQPPAKAVYSAHGVREGEGGGETELVDLRPVSELSGIAPECKIVSMKVLDATGAGPTTAIIRALQRVFEVNQAGRRLLIHGVNLSLGYDFNPEWFACGQSPLCVEVDRLVRSGVVVVVAAGNSGYGQLMTSFTGTQSAGLALTINDPGNAAAAITVGSTHKEMPHLYGASYFSSKGPTGDGRIKPDVLAPGEKILSCAAGAKLAEVLGRPRSAASQKKKIDDSAIQYIESSGTSMAAPHVSGAIAAFLSIRREFQGRPEEVKELFLANATDLHRDRYFQGHGLIDLMRTIQSV